MLVFATGGGALTLWGNQTLFDAVAVSGTASMFLTPVLLVALIGQRPVAPWAYVISFAAAMLGSAAYVFRDTSLINPLLVDGHKYEQLLQICIVVLVLGTVAVCAGIRGGARRVATGGAR